MPKPSQLSWDVPSLSCPVDRLPSTQPSRGGGGPGILIDSTQTSREVLVVVHAVHMRSDHEFMKNLPTNLGSTAQPLLNPAVSQSDRLSRTGSACVFTASIDLEQQQDSYSRGVAQYLKGAHVHQRSIVTPTSKHADDTQSCV